MSAAAAAFGPDFPFAYDDYLAHPAGLGSLPEEAHGSEVAVIGAGISGVVAAYELIRLGLWPVVYEAGRLGGRLRSERFGGADAVMAELGGMRFPVTGRSFFHYADLVGTETKPFPNPLTAAAPTTVIDLEGVSHYADRLEDLPGVFHEVADARERALEDHADFAGMKAAIVARDAAEVKRRWEVLVHAWDERTFSRLSYRHREIFGQVGFGTGGWDSDFPNSMLEILREATGRNVMSMTLTDRNTRGTYLFDNGPDTPAVICLTYAWMSDAMKVLPKSASERARLALGTLGKIYPGVNINSHVIGEPVTVSWEADPNSLGAFKGALPGHYRHNRRMYAHFMQEGMRPGHRGIFLAGDDVSWTPGWAEGAVQTALNAVWGIMTHFDGSTDQANPGPGDVWDDCQPPVLPDD